MLREVEHPVRYRGDLEHIKLPKHRKAMMSRAKMRLFLSLPRSIKIRVFYGKARYCPVCDSHLRRFENFGESRNYWCPICASMQRHRLAWLFLSRSTDLFDGASKKMLHIAPERGLARRFRWIPNLDYISADLNDPSSMVRMDVTNIQYADNTFDVIYCSHVLEHVVDDRRAIHELARVLKPGGWALFMVPLSERQTIEDSSITSPAERERLFGQHDHVRQYGTDLEDRLDDEFDVTVIEASQIASPEDTERMGLPARDSIFFCVKALPVP